MGAFEGVRTLALYCKRGKGSEVGASWYYDPPISCNLYINTMIGQNDTSSYLR